MPVKGVSQVKNNVGKWLIDVNGDTEKVLTSIVMTGIGLSQLVAPVDKKTLIDSKYYVVKGNQGIAGYKAGFVKETGFNYAAHLHETTNWKPRKKKDATHHFLSDAFESPEYRADYQRVIIDGYKI